ncbi:WD40 repeat-like protein [Metschnikowia bicuspidata]|uniref:WD40 repeat-like protein n=1 Tax=Metschnikowia bicuspidata TaxID=27322 RepID=A0A4P9Z887_9ASCO|nr:WD40 repeat-like protein [Metschnikowia bicuspidata]
MQIFTIQENFEEVIADVGAGRVTTEKFWLAHRVSEQLLYFSVEVRLDNDGLLQFIGTSEQPGVSLQFSPTANRLYTVAITGPASYGSPTYPVDNYTLRTPIWKHRFRFRVTLAELDTENRVILGTLDGNIHLYDTSGSRLATIAAHYSTITHLQLFPSGKALLSAGADFRIHIWDLDRQVPSQAARTFTKHTKTVTDIAFVGRGRNFVSSSDDGSAVLWECSSGNAVMVFRRISRPKGAAKCVAVATCRTEPVENQFRANMLFECLQIVVFVGYELGLVQQYSVAQNCATAVSWQAPAPVLRVCAFKQYVVVGCGDGLVVVWDWVGGSKHSLALSAENGIENLKITAASDTELVLVLSNGPESLFSVQFDSNTHQFRITHLVGLSEMFRVLLVGRCVATADEAAFF